MILKTFIKSPLSRLISKGKSFNHQRRTGHCGIVAIAHIGQLVLGCSRPVTYRKEKEKGHIKGQSDCHLQRPLETPSPPLSTVGCRLYTNLVSPLWYCTFYMPTSGKSEWAVTTCMHVIFIFVSTVFFFFNVNKSLLYVSLFFSSDLRRCC